MNMELTDILRFLEGKVVKVREYDAPTNKLDLSQGNTITWESGKNAVNSIIGGPIGPSY